MISRISRIGPHLNSKYCLQSSYRNLFGINPLFRSFAGAPRTLGPNRFFKAGMKAAENNKDKEIEKVHLNFKAFKLDDSLEEYLIKNEVMTPTPIQATLIPKVIEDPHKSFYVGAQTGSGKTLAYLLPIFTQLKKNEVAQDAKKGLTLSRRPRVLIICPSKELVHQVFTIAKDLSHHCKMRVAKLSGDQDFGRERLKLMEGCDIVIGTLKRVEHHINRRSLFTSQVETMVFDEADTILDSGEEETMGYFMRIVVNQDVIDQRGASARAIFVTATLGGALRTFLDTSFGKNNKNFEYLMDKSTHLNLSNIKHEFIHLSEFDKHKSFENVINEVAFTLKKFKRCAMIFCDTVKSAQSTEYFIRELGYDCVSLHGDIPARSRVQNYERFKNNEVPFLIATDLGSRGLDFRNVSHVINFDFPENASDYLHRVGRTGRAGDNGVAISLYRNGDVPLVNKLKESYEKGIPLLMTTSSYGKINKEDLKRKDSKKLKISNDAMNRVQSAQKRLREVRSLSAPPLEDSKPEIKSKPKRVMNFKKMPEEKEKKVYKTLRKELKKLPKSRRHQEQKYVRGISKRMRSVQRDLLKKNRKTK